MHQRRNGNTQDSSSNMHGRGGGGYNPGSLESGGGGVNARDTNSNIMEQQNNDRINELSDQVARLKGLTVDIGNEVREQNSMLGDMGENFGNVGDLLAGSLRRIGTMLESGGAKHMCYMIAFIVAVMIFLYWVMTYKGTNGI